MHEGAANQEALSVRLANAEAVFNKRSQQKDESSHLSQALEKVRRRRYSHAHTLGDCMSVSARAHHQRVFELIRFSYALQLHLCSDGHCKHRVQCGGVACGLDSQGAESTSKLCRLLECTCCSETQQKYMYSLCDAGRRKVGR